MLSTVSSKDHSSCAVQYTLKFVNELLVAASEKAVAIVQPRDNETVKQHIRISQRDIEMDTDMRLYYWQFNVGLN